MELLVESSVLYCVSVSCNSTREYPSPTSCEYCSENLIDALLKQKRMLWPHKLHKESVVHLSSGFGFSDQF